MFKHVIAEKQCEQKPDQKHNFLLENFAQNLMKRVWISIPDYEQKNVKN
jgi:hypothetical protein